MTWVTVNSRNAGYALSQHQVYIRQLSREGIIYRPKKSNFYSTELQDHHNPDSQPFAIRAHKKSKYTTHTILS
jgi:hypothetical protein